jgi:tetratricopeptide (TPR) repeat protein
VAETFLADYATPDVWRQLVEFERAMTYRDQNDLAAAVPLFQQIVATYATAEFATAPGALVAPNVVVDDCQYYVAAVQEPSGEVATVTAAYEALFTGFPDSNRIAQATLRLGNFLAAHGDSEGAIARLEDVVAQFPDSSLAPEAQVNIAGLYRSARQFDLAAQAYEEVVTRWPASPKCEFVVEHWNRMLMEQDGTAWSAGQLPAAGQQPGHLAAIAQNVEWLLREHPEAASAPGIVLDVINFLARSAVWGAVTHEYVQAETVRLAREAERVAPSARTTAVVKLNEAYALRVADPNRAWSLVDEVRAWAQAQNDEELLTGTLATSGELYSWQGRHADARAAWEAVLQRPQSPLFEGELKINIGVTYIHEGNAAGAATTLLGVANDDKYPADVRATARVSAALAFDRSGQAREALAQLDQVIAADPNTTTAKCAAHLRARLVRQLHP